MDDVDIRAEWIDVISPHVSHTGHSTFKRGVINPLRVIYDHELFMFASGQSKLVFGDQEFPCPTNTFLIIPPGKEHISYALSQEIHIHWMHFDWVRRRSPWRAPRMSFGGGRPQRRRIRTAPGFVPEGILCGTIESPMYVFDLHIRMCEAWETQDPRRRKSCRGLLLAVLTELLAPRTSGHDEARSSQLAERTRAHLTELANQPFGSTQSIKESLRQLGASYFHQERIFKRHYGISPSEYVSRLRVERIKSMLGDTEMPISQVARALGFDDPGYLSRLFRAHVGCSPREYRRRARRG